MNIEEILEKIGLNQKETKIYLAVLELGESTVLPIARKSQIQRTYCYDILDSLIKKGLVSYIEKRGRRYYIASNPENIRTEIEENKKNFENILPELLSLYQKSSLKPKVRFFEGREGIEFIHNELLKEANEVWFIGSIKAWSKKFPNYIEFVTRQIKKDLTIKDLVSPEKEVGGYINLYKFPKQQLRYLPKNIHLETDNIIWNNKIAMISYSKELHAVVIESVEISNTFRVIFNYLWNTSKMEYK